MRCIQYNKRKYRLIIYDSEKWDYEIEMRVTVHRRLPIMFKNILKLLNIKKAARKKLNVTINMNIYA